MINTKLVPHSEISNCDIISIDRDDTFYVIRPDLDLYITSSNFNTGANITVRNLHVSSKGNHYVARNHEFYIIKSKTYRRVEDMRSDKAGKKLTLHKKCQDGDHYMCTHSQFYIIKGQTVLQVSDMQRAADAREFTLHPKCRGGLYYWSRGKCFYFLKPGGESGFEYCRTTSLESASNFVVLSMSMDIVRFLPGGLAFEMPSSTRLEQIHAADNTKGSSEKKFTQSFTVKKGHVTKKETLIEHNWNIKIEKKINSGLLTDALVKSQLSLSAEYGGKNISTNSEEWSDERSESIVFDVTVPAGECKALYQAVHSVGQDLKIFGMDLKFSPKKLSQNATLAEFKALPNYAPGSA